MHHVSGHRMRVAEWVAERPFGPERVVAYPNLAHWSPYELVFSAVPQGDQPFHEPRLRLA